MAAALAKDTQRDAGAVRKEIEMQAKTRAPLGGLVDVDMVNVLEVNLELRRRYGEPSAPTA